MIFVKIESCILCSIASPLQPDEGNHYNTFMLILRRTFVVLLSLLFLASISTFVTSRSLSVVFGRSANIKAQLVKSGLYKDLPPQLYAKFRKSLNPNTTIAGASIERPEIEAAFLEALSPERMQRLTESSIDTFYNSIASPDANIQLNIDIGEVKQAFADGLAQRIQTRLSSLPVCRTAPVGTDPFTITCLPQGLNIQAESERIKKEVLSNQDFLPQSTISLDTLRNGDLTKTSQPTQSFQIIKNAYRWLMRLPWASGVLSLVLAALIVLVAPRRLNGIRTVFSILLVFGLINVVGITIASKVASSEIKANLSSEAPESIQRAALILFTQLQREIFIYSTAAAALGLAALIGITVFRRRQTNVVTPISRSPSSS